MASFAFLNSALLVILLLEAAGNRNIPDAIRSNNSSASTRSLCSSNANKKLFTYSCSPSAEKLRVLVVVQNILVPSQLGCDKRSFAVLEALATLGHEVFVAALTPSSTRPTAHEILIVQKLGINVLSKSILAASNPADEYRSSSNIFY